MQRDTRIHRNSASTAAPAVSSAAAPVNYSLTSNAPAGGNTTPLSVGGQFTGADYTLPETNFSNVGLQAPAQQSPYDYNIGSFDYSLAPSTPDTGLSYTPDNTIPDYVAPQDWKPEYSFADGGIVRGRGNTTAPMEPSDTPAAEMADEETEAKQNARFDAGFTANVFMDTFRKMLGENDLGKAEGYADGGTVRAGGSRRSANPIIDLMTPETSSAVQSAAAGTVGSQFADIGTSHLHSLW